MTLDAEWNRCAPWIQAALDHSGNTFGLDDVRAMVDAEDAQFWPGCDCAIVTQIEVHPLAKVLVFWLAGGDLNELVSQLRPRIEAWAAGRGCNRSLIIGRPGWGRALPDYDPIARVFSKELRP